jgi:hypothetical protein
VTTTTTSAPAPAPPAVADRLVDLMERARRAAAIAEQAERAGDARLWRQAMLRYFLRVEQYFYLKRRPADAWCNLCQPTRAMLARRLGDWTGEHYCLDHFTDALRWRARNQLADLLATDQAPAATTPRRTGEEEDDDDAETDDERAAGVRQPGLVGVDAGHRV